MQTTTSRYFLIACVLPVGDSKRSGNAQEAIYNLRILFSVPPRRRQLVNGGKNSTQQREKEESAHGKRNVMMMIDCLGTSVDKARTGTAIVRTKMSIEVQRERNECEECRTGGGGLLQITALYACTGLSQMSFATEAWDKRANDHWDELS